MFIAPSVKLLQTTLLWVIFKLLLKTAFGTIYLKFAPSIEFLKLLLGCIHMSKIGCLPCDPGMLQGLKCGKTFLGVKHNELLHLHNKKKNK